MIFGAFDIAVLLALWLVAVIAWASSLAMLTTLLAVSRGFFFAAFGIYCWRTR